MAPCASMTHARAAQTGGFGHSWDLGGQSGQPVGSALWDKEQSGERGPDVGGRHEHDDRHVSHSRTIMFLLQDISAQHANVTQALGSVQPINILNLCFAGNSRAPLPRPPWSSLGPGKALSRVPPGARNSVIYLN